VNIELVINSTATEVLIALLHDRRLVELHREERSSHYAVGDIYLGRIKKIMPGLNAAFVDVGYEKDAFLHYLDLGPQVKSQLHYSKLVRNQKQHQSLLNNFHKAEDIPKDGKITDVLEGVSEVVVQVAKEPISAKGPRISSEISIAGRYLVLVPFSDKISISQKIRNSEERQKLKRSVEAIVPKNFGVIIRTVAEGKSIEEIQNDLTDLLKRWDELYKNLKETTEIPSRVLGELDRTSAILRDLLNDSFNTIHVNEQTVYDEIYRYLGNIAPEKANIVKHYKGSQPIFDYFGVEKQIKALFGRKIGLKNGAYLILDHTEALHVFDVNSGNRTKTDNNQEENALDVNMDAAIEIARQLRLRDMGGIIVVDFIDLHNSENREILFKKLKEEMKYDRAKHQILPPSKFGLVQITRQRVRPEMNVITAEKCIVCNGTGEIQASILLLDEIENDLKYLAEELNHKKLVLNTHPFVASHLNEGFWWNKLKNKWASKYKVNLKVNPFTSYHYMEYRFFNTETEEEIKF
jgi:ribonuclease G